MYIPPVQQVYHHVLRVAATTTTTLGDSGSEVLLDGGGGWTLGGFVAVLRTIVLYMVCLLGRWSSAIVSALREFFDNPGAFMIHGLILGYDFLHNHPHIVYLTCLSLFFGPVIILIPFLLFYEIAILLLFNLSFVTHGLIPGAGSTQDRYDALKEQFMDSREQVFASVDASTAIFNKWTSDHFILMLTRLAGGVVGIYTLYGVWEEWSRV